MLRVEESSHDPSVLRRLLLITMGISYDLVLNAFT